MLNSLKNKKLLILIVLSIIFLSSCLCSCSKDKESPKEAFEKYKQQWEKGDYKGLYGMVSSTTKEKVTEKEFIERYEKIFGDIEAKNISIKAKYPQGIEKIKEEEVKIPFSLTMDTLVGTVTVDNFEAILQKERIDKEEKWLLKWSTNMIFPQLDSDDKVGLRTLLATRGEIYDRKGKPLAINGQVLSVAIEPKRFQPYEENIKKMAEILDISESTIREKLEANTNPDWQVPIVNISKEDVEKKYKLYPLAGVVFNRVESRVYPGKEACGSLIGYIGPITQEELEKLKSDGYSSQCLIGKMGLEQVYDKRLKGENGAEIYISKIEEGREIEKITIAKKEPKNGENIKIAIDLDLQEKIYKTMRGEPGSSAAVEPKTGEVLALVSSPNFDSNMYTTYISKTMAEKMKNSDTNPTFNRFNKVYCPGSTFKLITSAIGLNTGVIDPEEGINISGKQWQGDSSWGNYKVTRVNNSTEPINLTKALVYSDNIYFAMQARKIGAEKYIEGAKKFGIGEEFPFEFPFQKSQLMNGDTIESDILLADSGYGQGEILMSPLHLSLCYSALVNNGDIMKPVIELKEGWTASIWKEKAIKADKVGLLRENFKKVVEDPKGTGHEAKIAGRSIGGKTGTAQLQKSHEDTTAEENGWFVAFDTENPDFVITMMIQNVKDKGGSHYVVPMVRDVLK